VLTLGDAAYPPELLQMADPPLLLYVLGQLGGPAPPARLVAVVGSRNPTPQGLPMPGSFACAWVKPVCAWCRGWRWAWTAPRTWARSKVAARPSPWWAPGWTGSTPSATWNWPTASRRRAPW
jgi:hypothetical protein